MRLRAGKPPYRLNLRNEIKGFRVEQTSSIVRDMTRAQENTVLVWRIYTEDAPNLPELVSRYVDGATLTLGTGLYCGQPEMCRVIEIIGPARLTAKVRFLAEDIKAVNGQREVLVTVAKWKAFTV